MQPKLNSHRQQYPGGKYVRSYRFENIPKHNGVFDINDNSNDFNDIFSPMDNFDFSESAFENANIDINPNMTGDDEKRRIEALKRAVDIAKLMDNVNVENILDIAEKVDKYLQTT